MMRNLKAEMERYGVSIHDIHILIGKTERSARDKINGKATFTLPEAVKIRDTYFRTGTVIRKPTQRMKKPALVSGREEEQFRGTNSPLHHS